MSKEDNIRAILETHFTGFREDIIESAVKRIMDATEERHDGVYCDRNICTKNEYNGISCDECEVAKYNNLEDDDSPCQNCGE